MSHCSFHLVTTAIYFICNYHYNCLIQSLVCSILGSRFWENVKEILNPETSVGAPPWIYYSIYAFFVFLFNIFDIVSIFSASCFLSFFLLLCVNFHGTSYRNICSNKVLKWLTKWWCLKFIFVLFHEMHACQNESWNLSFLKICGICLVVLWKKICVKKFAFNCYIYGFKKYSIWW